MIWTLSQRLLKLFRLWVIVSLIWIISRCSDEWEYRRFDARRIWTRNRSFRITLSIVCSMKCRFFLLSFNSFVELMIEFVKHFHCCLILVISWSSDWRWQSQKAYVNSNFIIYWKMWVIVIALLTILSKLRTEVNTNWLRKCF